MEEKKKQKESGPSGAASKDATPVPGESPGAGGRSSTSGQEKSPCGDKDGEEEQGEDSEGRLVPQLRIGADGSIVIDETRYVIT